MDRRLEHKEESDIQELFSYLEKEKQAGIPPIPENLKPEHIEKLLEDRSERKQKRKGFILGGGLTVAISAAICILFLPNIFNKSGLSGSPAVTGQNQSADIFITSDMDAGQEIEELLPNIEGIWEEAADEAESETATEIGTEKRWDRKKSEKAKRPSQNKRTVNEKEEGAVPAKGYILRHRH